MISQSQSEVASATRFRNLKAILNLQPIISSEPLHVTGQYHLDQRCGGVSLRKAVPQGLNPAILLLEIVEAKGDGGDWVTVEGRFPAREQDYELVQVRDMDGETISIEIEVVH